MNGLTFEDIKKATDAGQVQPTQIFIVSKPKWDAWKRLYPSAELPKNCVVIDPDEFKIEPGAGDPK
jgi:hypothetical protein